MTKVVRVQLRTLHRRLEERLSVERAFRAASVELFTQIQAEDRLVQRSLDKFNRQLVQYWQAQSWFFRLFHPKPGRHMVENITDLGLMFGIEESDVFALLIRALLDANFEFNAELLALAAVDYVEVGLWAREQIRATLPADSDLFVIEVQDQGLLLVCGLVSRLVHHDVLGVIPGLDHVDQLEVLLHAVEAALETQKPTRRVQLDFDLIRLLRIPYKDSEVVEADDN